MNIYLLHRAKILVKRSDGSSTGCRGAGCCDAVR